MLMAATLLAAFVFIADTALHVFTQTVPYSQVSSNLKAVHEFGRGLMDECPTFNRSANHGFPRTTFVKPGIVDYMHTREVTLVLNNISTNNQIQTVSDGNVDVDVAFLLPASDQLSSNIDFGVSSIACGDSVSDGQHEMSSSCAK